MAKIPAAAHAARNAQESARHKRRQRSAIGVAVAIAIALTGALVAFQLTGSDQPCGDREPSTRLRFPGPPPMTIDVDHTFYIAHLDTSVGKIDMTLDTVLGPRTVNNFVFLARAGFYDGMTFHRVESTADHALVQTGDPCGTGHGGPGYTYDGEKPSPITQYNRGTVAMANTGDPSSNGSQFFIIARDHPALSSPRSFPRYTFFGYVTSPESLETLDKMVSVPLDGTRPITSIRLNTVTIEETKDFPLDDEAP